MKTYFVFFVESLYLRLFCVQSMVLHELSVIRESAGKSCKKELHHTNSPLTMATVRLKRVVHQHLADDSLCGSASHQWEENSRWI